MNDDGRREKLLQTRKIFEEIEDWNEVSKIQFEIDSLPKPKGPEPKIETWFKAVLFNYYIKTLRSEISEDLYKMRVIKRMKGDEDA